MIYGHGITYRGLNKHGMKLNTHGVVKAYEEQKINIMKIIEQIGLF